jgi:hypothetical protein
LQEVSSFYFQYVSEANRPYSLTLISFIPPPTSIPRSVPTLQSCILLLIVKPTFKGVSRCIPSVSILYCGQFNPFQYSPFSPPSPHYSTAFNTYCCILCLHRYYIFWYCWCSVILFSSSSSRVP